VVTNFQPSNAPILIAKYDLPLPPIKIQYMLQNLRNVLTKRRINNNAFVIQVIQKL
jgi:hypothetical protein